jgi:hypothetical protein
MAEQYVYFIQAGDSGPIKIGTAMDTLKRLKQLQTSSAEALVVLGHREGDEELEEALHERFAEHRLRGEWFRPAEAILIEIAATCSMPAPKIRRERREKAEPATPPQKTFLQLMEAELADCPEQFYPFRDAVLKIKDVCGLETDVEAVLILCSQPTAFKLITIDPDSAATAAYLNAAAENYRADRSILFDGPYGEAFTALADRLHAEGVV